MLQQSLLRFSCVLYLGLRVQQEIIATAKCCFGSQPHCKELVTVKWVVKQPHRIPAGNTHVIRYTFGIEVRVSSGTD
jgi:hypothetical protein